MDLKIISESSRKKRKNYNNVVLLPKAKLNVIEVLISKALKDSYINHGKAEKRIEKLV